MTQLARIMRNAVLDNFETSGHYAIKVKKFFLLLLSVTMGMS